MKLKSIIICVFVLFAASNMAAQSEAPQKYEGNAQKIEEWKNDRFGMFIHWGPVSLSGKEISWSRGSETPIDVYDHFYEQFNPVGFNADEWVKVAKEAGMKYIVLVTKHHDGFCMWNTHQTDYNIMNTPFKRDVVKELSDACKRQGIKFGTYYSTCDWHNPDFPLTSPGGNVKREKSDLEAYTSYLKRETAELMVNYGPLYVMWFDVPQMFDAKRGQGVIDFLRALKPDIIVNNRVGADGDFDTPEQRIGGFNNQRPWETNMTIADQWAWKPNDKVKTLQQCLQTLLRTVGGDGNLLFNISPKPDGTLEPEQVARLKEMGQWLEKYGESVYGTRGGPFKPTDWGVSTHKENSIYLHILSWQGTKPVITLPDLGIAIKNCTLLGGGSVKFVKKGNSYMLTLPAKSLKPIDTIVKLEMAGDVTNVSPVDLQSQSLSYGKKVMASSEPDQGWHPASCITNGDWASMAWIPDDAQKDPWIAVDFGKTVKMSKAILFEKGENVKSFELQSWNGEKWNTIHKGSNIGSRLEINLPKTMTTKVRLLLTNNSATPEIAEMIIL